jgi:hypothetical protein
MKKPASITQYTLRNVPPHVDRALRKMAHAHEQSLNQFILETLERVVGGDTAQGESARFGDLDKLIGSWVEDTEFDKALEDQSAVDRELWK